jgi:hypothetical protein
MMLSNQENGSMDRNPTMRSYLNLLSLDEQPHRTLEDVRAAGYDGVQFAERPSPDQLRECERLGLGRAGSGRVNHPGEVRDVASQAAGDGLECVTLHAGWGMEDDLEASRLMEAILKASEMVPMYVETHRATIFQDMWRSVGFVRRFPELRFNGDFSHWYTGLEMVYGGFDAKVAFIEPVLERIRFVHGRIGNPGCIQVDIGDGDAAKHSYVSHFRELWTRSFLGFLNDGDAADNIVFSPELLSPRIYYGRIFQGHEECNRWEQSLVLRRIARECFEAARQRRSQNISSSSSFGVVM